MDFLKKLAELIPFLEPYPMWVKALVGIWTLLSALLVLSFLFAPRSEKDPTDHHLSGRVVSVGADPIAAAAVEILIAGSNHETQSDSDGYFGLDLPAVKRTTGRVRVRATGFRPYEKVVHLRKDVSDLGLFKLQPETGPGPAVASDESIADQIERRQALLLEPPRSARDQYAYLDAAGDGGVVKLLSEREVEKNRALLRIQGQGSYYSFARRTHEYGHGSDIALRDGKLTTGFAGLDFGHFLNVGGVDFQQLVNTSQAPPDWLPSQKRAAWEFMWSYSPPQVTREVRQHQRDARTKTVAGVSVAERAAAVPGNAYLLRSISYRDSDLLVAIKVERITEDGSIILVWKVLRTFDTPVASGPEPEQ